MFVRKFIVIAILSGFAWNGASAQEVKARVAGLEADSQYMSLLLEAHRLAQREDSLNTAADRARDLYRTDAGGRKEHAARILELERAIFDVRDSLGTLDIRLGAIEQDWIIRNMDKAPARQTVPDADEPLFVSPEPHNPNLIYNEFFRSNLASPDYAALVRAQESERPAETYVKIMLFNQRKLKALDSLYSAAQDEAEADSLYSLAEHYDKLNALIADTLAPIWNKAFDTKVYTYNYLLDKFNRTAMLDRFEELMVAMRRERTVSAGKYFSDEAAWYPLQKKLLLGYELQLAETLGLRKAADSLRKVEAGLDPDAYRLPDAMPRKRVFMDFADAAPVRPAKYTSANPVPQVRIYPEGTIYRILLGSYVRPQPYSIFKYVYPLAYERKADNRYYYYAGGYSDYDKAEAAAALMKRTGFTKPAVVAWRDGAYDPSPKAETEQVVPTGRPQSPPAVKSAAPLPANTGKPAAVKTGSGVFRVEITGSETLPSGVREAIAAAAPGKEISRAVNPQTGEVTFSVGNFPDRETAAAVASAAGSAGNLKTDIISIGQ